MIKVYNKLAESFDEIAVRQEARALRLCREGKTSGALDAFRKALRNSERAIEVRKGHGMSSDMGDLELLAHITVSRIIEDQVDAMDREIWGGSSGGPGIL